MTKQSFAGRAWVFVCLLALSLAGLLDAAGEWEQEPE